MPIREYVCTTCTNRFERIFKTHAEEQRVMSEGPNECPNCGSTDVTKQIGQTARPKFQGSGFYETDYKNK